MGDVGLILRARNDANLTVLGLNISGIDFLRNL